VPCGTACPLEDSLRSSHSSLQNVRQTQPLTESGFTES
jgi:hypothetical protein